MPGDHSELEPPLPIPNRTVKQLRADDSADSRVKVGHRQALIVQNPSTACAARGFCFSGARSRDAAQLRQPTPERPGAVRQSPYRVRTQKSKLRLWERSGSARCEA